MAPANLLFLLVVAAYPVIVYIGLQYLDGQYVGLALIAVALARFAMGHHLTRFGGTMPQTNIIVILLLAVGVLALATNSATLLRYYPVGVNALMFTMFASSLFYPPTIIERIARVTTPDLPASGVAYTRKITIVWCGFFILNATMATYTVLFASLEVWTVYNSAISYALMGLLLGGELVVRRYILRNTLAASDLT
jgi:uncharacterized membrane protein